MSIGNSINSSPEEFTQSSGELIFTDRVRLSGTVVGTGYVENLGVSYSSNTLSVTGSGAALSATNPGYVVIQSKSTPGQYVKITITADQGFLDDTGASEIIGNLFGLPTGVAYASDIPFYLYAVLNDAEDTIKFACARVPHRQFAPITTGVGCPGTANADLQGDIFIFDTVTVGDYDTNPCMCIGSFRMQMSASDDWTVSALASTDGIGLFNENTLFTVPLGVFGAATGTYLKDNTGTAPVFSSNTYEYFINRFGMVIAGYEMSGDGGTDGVGAVRAEMAAPIIPAETEKVINQICLLIYSAGVGVSDGHAAYNDTFDYSWIFANRLNQGITNALFTHGSRAVSGKQEFLASFG